MFSFLHPVAKIWLIGWRKHLTTSQTTPKWSVGPLLSVVLPLQIPQRSKVVPSTKAVWKMQASTFKIMKKKTTSSFHDFILLYLWVVWKINKAKAYLFLFLSDWKYIIRTIIRGKVDSSRTKLEEKRNLLKQYPC